MSRKASAFLAILMIAAAQAQTYNVLFVGNINFNGGQGEDGVKGYERIVIKSAAAAAGATIFTLNTPATADLANFADRATNNDGNANGRPGSFANAIGGSVSTGRMDSTMSSYQFAVPASARYVAGAVRLSGSNDDFLASDPISLQDANGNWLPRVKANMLMYTAGLYPQSSPFIPGTKFPPAPQNPDPDMTYAPQNVQTSRYSGFIDPISEQPLIVGYLDFQLQNPAQAPLSNPVIESIAPESGVIAGGGILTVTGYGFGPQQNAANVGHAIQIGSVSCPIVTTDGVSFAYTYTMLCTVPPVTDAAAVQVQVTTTSGAKSATSNTKTFTYVVPGATSDARNAGAQVVASLSVVIFAALALLL